MPTHRDLAHVLGISVQTVSLSYKEAERRGYLRGEVGRGTFVRSRVTERADSFMLDRDPSGSADLSIIRAVYTETHERSAQELMRGLAESDNSSFMRPCRPIAGLDAHRAAGQKWLAQLSVNVDPDRILITNGGPPHAWQMSIRGSLSQKALSSCARKCKNFIFSKESPR